MLIVVLDMLILSVAVKGAIRLVVFLAFQCLSLLQYWIDSWRTPINKVLNLSRRRPSRAPPWDSEWDADFEWQMFLKEHGLSAWHPWAYYGPGVLDDLVGNMNPLSLLQILKEPYLCSVTREAGFEELLLPAASAARVGMLSEVHRLIPSLQARSQGSVTVYLSALDDCPVILDSGASLSLTPRLTDFVTGVKPCPSHPCLKQLTSEVKVEGMGTVRWTLNDAFGNAAVVETTALYVPQAEVRLLSPQTWFSETNAGSLTIDKDGCSLYHPLLHTEFFWNHHQHSNLPVVPVAAEGQAYKTSWKPAAPDRIHVSLMDEVNANLSAASKELLLWHCKLGHAGFAVIKALFTPRVKGQEPVLKCKHKQLLNETAIKCASCQVSNAKRRSVESAHSDPVQAKLDTITAEDLIPGQAVSLDQYESRTLGRLVHTFGKESSDLKYSGGTIFVDHASKVIFVRHQVSPGAEETVRSKHAFERFADEHGVSVRSYHADNGVFQAQPFKADCAKQEQPIDFSGVGAHHQNGIAESGVGKVVRHARVQMIHAAIHYPETAESIPELWPFAIDHAVFLWNALPDKSTGLSPLELFADATMDHSHLRQAHVWGCPVFVLDPRLQDGKRIPKWTRRARQGQYLGNSTAHGSNIALVKNLQTGSISPQFHCVFDDRFETVLSLPADQPLPADTWTDLCLSGHERYLDPAIEPKDIPPLGSEWATDETEQQQLKQQALDHHKKYHWTREECVKELQHQLDDTQRRLQQDLTASPEPEAPASEPDKEVASPPPQATRRSKRLAAKPTRSWANFVHLDTAKVQHGVFNWAFLTQIPWLKPRSVSLNSDLNAFSILLDRMTDPDTDEVDVLDYRVLAAQALPADTYKWNDAMRGPYKKEFWESALSELKTLNSMDVWDVVDRQPWMHVLKSTWVFKIKRFPSGLIKKFKGRFVGCGYDQIQGIDVFETFAPVAKWTTIRLLLLLSIELNLKTVQADVELAFPHAPVEEEIYVDMPQGFSTPGKVLKLKKTLYGIKQGPRNFFKFLKKQLEKQGFRQSEFDPCLFIRPDMLCLVYVDDLIFLAKDESKIDKMLQALLADGLKIHRETDMAGYLGVDIHRLPDGSIELLQTGLTKRILSALHLDDAGYSKKTPAAYGALPKDKDGAPADGKFSYASVVGMLLYLCGHSRAELQFAVSQCARFVHSPTRLHEEALIRIGLYLKGTADKGMIIKPSGSLQVHMHVDSDFAGLWGYENPCDPACVKSRAGWIVWIGGCPVIWGSRLINQIALSTMEAEYYSMSLSMKELIPFLDLLKEVSAAVDVPEEDRELHTSVFEDNSACLVLATTELPRTTPRSKHFAVKYHWFRAKIEEYLLKIKACLSADNVADIMTKGLRVADFVRMRKKLCGW